MTITILLGDVLDRLRQLPADSVHCVVTSPPYWGLRDYGVAGQIGLEPTYQEHISKMVEVFREVRRVLRPDGTCWMNYGDCYASSVNGRSAADSKATGTDDLTFRDKPFSTVQGVLKPKDLVMMPHRIAISLQEDGWWVRSDIVWHKTNSMPCSVKDRPTPAKEYLFLLTKSARYFYDGDAIREPRTSDEDAATFRGGCYVSGLIDNDQMGKRQVVGNRKVPARDNFRRDGSNRAEPMIGQTCGTHRPDRKDTVPAEDGLRNRRDVWSIATEPFSEAHFATMPTRLVEPCILAGCPSGGVVLDPFFGAGTVGLVAQRLARHAIGVELNTDYVAIAEKRLRDDAPLLADVRVVAGDYRESA